MNVNGIIKKLNNQSVKQLSCDMDASVCHTKPKVFDKMNMNYKKVVELR